MALENGPTLQLVGRSKQMPLENAQHLARVLKPYVDAFESQIEAEAAWGVSQSHISQILQGAGCGIAVLLRLRGKLKLDLETLCVPPSQRFTVKPPPPDLDALRAVLREELANATPSQPPSEPPAPPPKGKSSDAPRPRRR